MQHAIKQIDYIDAQKTLFLCKDSFWEKGNPSERIHGGASITDLLIQSTYYPSNKEHLSSSAIHNTYGDSKSSAHTSIKPGVIITSYNLGLDSLRLGTMNKEERFALIKRQVEEVHGLPLRYLDDIVIGDKTIEWNSEFWFSGAFTRFFPGQRLEFLYEISIPEYDNRVFFAGEHTSVKGCQQGSHFLCHFLKFVKNSLGALTNPHKFSKVIQTIYKHQFHRKI